MWGMGCRPELPQHLATRSFTTREGARRGVSTSRLRAKDLYVPSRDVRVPRGNSQPPLGRVRPYVELGVECHVSHTTAAILHGIPMPYGHEEPGLTHLERPAGTMIPRRKGVIGDKRELGSEEFILVDGVPVTTPARPMLDLAGILNLDELAALADHGWLQVKVFTKGLQRGDNRVVERFRQALARQGWNP